MSRLIDLTGRRFGRLIVIKRMGNNEHGQSMWLCFCRCEYKVVIRGSHLTSGVTKSCGCLQIAIVTKHGCYNNKIYKIWATMIQRCKNPNNKQWKNYGGRGIKVCKRWLKFGNFLEDMGESPSRFQIDRIDNNADYSKKNCRWVTSKINNRNRRNNRLIVFDGKTQCLAEWAEEIGIPESTIHMRIDQYGWSVEKTLTVPVRKYKKRRK